MLAFLRKVFLTVAQWIHILFGGSRFAGPAPDAGPTPDVEKQVVSELKATTAEFVMGSADAPHYQMRDSLFTFQERKFYEVLREAANEKYQVFAKVRMADFVWLTNEPIDRKFYNNQILCKHVDFLLCEPASLKPLMVIELDDSSHQWPDRRDNDAFKDKTFDSIGLPMERIAIEQEYSAAELRQRIDDAIRENIGTQE